jgi:hypothetical protein
MTLTGMTKNGVKVRFAEPGGEDLVVQSRTGGGKLLTKPGFSETEVIIQPGRFARLACIPAGLRSAHRVGCNVVTQVVEEPAGVVFVALGGARIFLNDLPVGQFVEALPDEPQDGPAVRVFLPRPTPVLYGAVAVPVYAAIAA